MDKNYCIEKVKEYIVSSNLNIEMKDFEKRGQVFKVNYLENTVKIIGIENATIISVSKDLEKQVKKEFMNKSRDIVFENPITYGETIFYIPNFSKNEIINNNKYKVEYFIGQESIEKLKFPKSFNDCITYDDNNNLLTDIVAVVFDNGKIVSCAGAMKVFDGIYEMGIDTLPEYERRGFAVMLSNALRLKLQEMNIVPIWRASVTNIGSQNIAQRAGFVPYYISSFGTLGDKFCPYNNLFDKKINSKSAINRI